MQDTQAHRDQYIILPEYGFRGEALAQSEKLQSPGTFTVYAHPNEAGDGSSEVRVVHSLHADGPKLVEMSELAELKLRTTFSGLKIVPLVRYRQMRATPSIERLAVENASVEIAVEDLETGAGVSGARVIAFTNYRHRLGAEGRTDRGGRLALPLRAGTRIERLYVFGPAMYWGRLETGIDLSPRMTLTIRPIHPERFHRGIDSYFGHLPEDAGRGVKIGVVDSGIQEDHPALPNVSGGRNLVLDELHEPGSDGEWGPAHVNGEHGTHVAGIVGMHRSDGGGPRGVAPGAELRSYRVFPNEGGGATNYDIVNAIDSAIEDGCDIVNLSLGGGTPDEAVRSVVGYAASRGVLVVAAAGNDGRRPVSFPAAVPACVAVSAMGTRGCFPPESTESGDIAKPFGRNDGEFVAAFSNYGPPIGFTAPGVGIISTVPVSKWGVMSGTSMACPAVAGFAAHLLSMDDGLRAMVGEARTRALRQALELSAEMRGFGRDYEGFGLPRQIGT